MRIAHDLRINERIFAKTVRLISESGEQMGLMTIDQALESARRAELDLVEVAPDAQPPVCRIMDYGKFKYRQKKKTHQGQKRHAAQMKEIRLRPKTDEHDLLIKARHAREFIERKDKVLVNLLFRGRERAHVDVGRAVLERFMAAMQDVAKVEQLPKLEGSRMALVLAPK